MAELIHIQEICSRYEIEDSFLHELDGFSLIERVQQQDGAFIHLEQLPVLEKIIRIRRDLEINVEGISVIFELLEKIKNLRHENELLKREINLYINL